MFSPTKAITAAALVFGVGSVLYLAQPLGQEGGSPPGAATDAAPQPPTEVSGHIECGPEVRSGTYDSEAYPLADGQLVIGRTQGYAWQPTATMSDPRLEGTYHISYDDDAYTYPGATFDRLGTGTWRIENEEGAWQGSYTNAGLTDDTMTAATTILTGEGADEGMSVYWEIAPGTWSGCAWDVRGLIIDGTVPPAPEPFLGE